VEILVWGIAEVSLISYLLKAVSLVAVLPQIFCSACVSSVMEMMTQSVAEEGDLG